MKKVVAALSVLLGALAVVMFMIAWDADNRDNKQKDQIALLRSEVAVLKITNAQLLSDTATVSKNVTSLKEQINKPAEKMGVCVEGTVGTNAYFISSIESPSINNGVVSCNTGTFFPVTPQKAPVGD